jgi:hypothetical protein
MPGKTLLGIAAIGGIMHKNICSGCKYNFGTLESFEKHRTGEFGVDRRCMTPREMEEWGWEFSTPLVTFYREGVSYQKETATWVCPVSESRQKSLDQLRSRN